MASSLTAQEQRHIYYDGSKFKNATTAGVEHIDVRFYTATQINFSSYACSVFNVMLYFEQIA